MDDKIDEIQKHIDYERRELGRNFAEIEDRVKKATDMKAIFKENTGVILGAALAGGYLISVAFSKCGAQAVSDSEASQIRTITPTATHSRRLASKHFDGITSTLDNIVGGLIGVASGKLVTTIADSVPGFRDHFESGNSKQTSSQSEEGKDGTSWNIH